MDLSEALARMDQGFSVSDASALVDLLLSGALSPEAGGDLLRRLHERRETAEELVGVVRALLARAQPQAISTPVLDVCGTGGSGRARFNVSTCVAAVCAAAGVPTGKHGNRGSRRPDGSFDVLEALGVRLDPSPQQLAAAFSHTHLAYVFARVVHPAVAAAAPYRKAAGSRTIFNLAGPLANPLPVRARLIGTLNEQTALLMLGALQGLGAQSALMVWGHPGMDEASVTGPTGFIWLHQGRVERGSFTAALPGLKPEQLPGDDAATNAPLLSALLQGQGHPVLRAQVALNAGLALDLWAGRRPEPRGAGVRAAEDLLDSGAAWETFLAYRQAVAKAD